MVGILNPKDSNPYNESSKIQKDDCCHEKDICAQTDIFITLILCLTIVLFSYALESEEE